MMEIIDVELHLWRRQKKKKMFQGHRAFRVGHVILQTTIIVLVSRNLVKISWEIIDDC